MRKTATPTRERSTAAGEPVLIGGEAENLITRMRRWAGTPNGAVWLDAAWVFLLTRALFLAITYMTPSLFPGAGIYGPHAQGSLGWWATQDAWQFIQIAQTGYHGAWLTAYWPMMPGLTHALGPLTGGNYRYSGLLVANVSGFALLVLLRRLAERELGAETGRRAMLYLAVFPTAFYLFAPYAESLFLALTVGAFLALRERRWLLAGLLGGLATLTKSNGILLTIPFAVEFYLAWRAGAAHWARLAYGALIPAGAALYAVYCWAMFGDPLAFAHAQHVWGRTAQAPWVTLADAIGGLFLHSAGGSVAGAHLLLNLAAVLVFLALLVPIFRLLPASYGLYSAAVILYFLTFAVAGSTFALQGDGRYVLMVFPAFMVLGALGRRRWIHEGLLIVMLPMLAILAGHYLLGLATG
ncbi:MAG TPA: glycosyltransferase family 39 protein [Ktedonobacterales bacterium]|nr:glycosyltransferase family 39 protein [Ktedonobacterales bacterium]